MNDALLCNTKTKHSRISTREWEKTAVCTWAAAKFSASSFLLVAGKKTMLSMVWISSSCTTHFMSKAENKRCSWISVGYAGKKIKKKKEVNQKMYAGKKKHTGVKNLGVKWRTDLFGSCSLDHPRSRLRPSCTDSADDSPSQLCRSCWWNAGHQSGTGCPMTSGKLSPGSKVNRGTAIMQELYV